jgi:hypothetical protein
MLTERVQDRRRIHPLRRGSRLWPVCCSAPWHTRALTRFSQTTLALHIEPLVQALSAI